MHRYANPYKRCKAFRGIISIIPNQAFYRLVLHGPLFLRFVISVIYEETPVIDPPKNR